MIDFGFFIFYIMPWIIVALVALFIYKRGPPGHKGGEVKKCIYCGATIGVGREFCGKCSKKQPTYGHLPPKL